jgi:hypothetical protein
MQVFGTLRGIPSCRHRTVDCPHCGIKDGFGVLMVNARTTYGAAMSAVALFDRGGMKALLDELPHPSLDEEFVDPGECDIAEDRHHVVAEIALVTGPRRRAEVHLRLQPFMGPVKRIRDGDTSASRGALKARD